VLLAPSVTSSSRAHLKKKQFFVVNFGHFFGAWAAIDQGEPEEHDVK